MSNDDLEPLRVALQVSPDNIPLRLHLAKSLMDRGRSEEAEQEYRTALQQDANNVEVKLGLAHCYHSQGKQSHALVIIEELVKQDSPPGEAFLLYTRLLIHQGEVENAIAQYRLGLETNPEIKDELLEEQLGIDATPEESDVVEGRVRNFTGDDPNEHQEADQEYLGLQMEHPEIGFNSVGGMEEVKEQVRMKIIYPLEHAEMFAQYGKKIGGGVLMYGAPGCGKTHLARATAGEINANFINVGISDVLEMWVGSSERNLEQYFQLARRNKPTVLFFDEIDALGANRSDMRSNASRHLINQFLSELDGIESSNDGVLILAATNAPWHLDPAFRRPGRFDRVLFVPPPDAQARAEILRIMLKDKPQDNIDFDYLGKLCKELSGADLKGLVDTAIESVLETAMKTGKPEPLTTKILKAAAKKTRPTTKEWFATAKNYAMFSNEGGVYDDILEYLKLK